MCDVVHEYIMISQKILFFANIHVSESLVTHL